MKNLQVPIKSESLLLTLALTGFFCISPPPVYAQSQSTPAQGSKSAQDTDINYGQLANFDNFLDKHRELAEQLRKDPSLVRNEDFVNSHPALRDYFRDNPDVREEIRENPQLFMRAENRVDRLEGRGDKGDITRGELQSFDNFLDRHREISEQLHKNPSLANDPQFLKDHPALGEYLQAHRGVREEIRENPNVFVQAENRFDRREDDLDRRNGDRDASRDIDRGVSDRDRGDRRDITRGELQSFDSFLDRHREISERLHKNPSLANDPQFLKDHPALGEYLQAHQGVRAEIRENPAVFLQAENRLDQREGSLNHRADDSDRDRRAGERTGDMDRDSSQRSHMHRNFGAFMNSHSELAEQLTRDPDQVKNDTFLKSHPELKEYLDQHPGDRQALLADPHAFIMNSQKFANTAKPPAVAPKPKQ